MDFNKLKSFISNEPKNFIISVTAAVLAVVCMFVAIFGGGSSAEYDKRIADLQEQLRLLQEQSGGALSDYGSQLAGLQDRLDDLETNFAVELNDLKEQLGAGESGNKVYELGDTVTVYNNGLKLFEITYVRIDSSHLTVYFDITNFAVAGATAGTLIKSRSYSSEKQFFQDSIPTNRSLPLNESITCDIGHNPNCDYFYLSCYVSNGFIPFAIFKV